MVKYSKFNARVSRSETKWSKIEQLDYARLRVLQKWRHGLRGELFPLVSSFSLFTLSDSFLTTSLKKEIWQQQQQQQQKQQHLKSECNFIKNGKAVLSGEIFPGECFPRRSFRLTWILNENKIKKTCSNTNKTCI